MFKFTAQNNFGIYEEFSGYDTIDEALDAQDDLEAVGYSDFCFPIDEEEEYPEDF